MPPLSVDTVAWRTADGIGYLTWPVFDDLAVDVAVTTRQGGVSGGGYGTLNVGLHVGDDDELVIENRRRAARTVGADLDDLVFCNQTHGREVARVTGADRGRGATTPDTAVDGVDALVTTDAAPVLVMMVADCVPIALYAPGAHVAGAVHSGWRGTVRRIAEAAVIEMAALGAEPGEIVAAIGPAVDPAHYEVGPEVVEAATECFAGEIDGVLSPADPAAGTYLFDLWEANRRILLQAGLHPERIRLAGVPTGGDGPFFSHRAAPPCGRNAMLVRLRPRP